jgi:flagellar secretion chaperone FliS
MNTSQQDYLTTQVMTATPQQLQLLLVEGALRLIQQTRKLWKDGDNYQASETLIRCQQVVAEMIAGLNINDEPELVKKMVAVYMFVYTALVEANFLRSEAKLDDAVRVLEIERGTWRMASEHARKAPHVSFPNHEHVSEGGLSFTA